MNAKKESIMNDKPALLLLGSTFSAFLALILTICGIVVPYYTGKYGSDNVAFTLQGSTSSEEKLSKTYAKWAKDYKDSGFTSGSDAAKGVEGTASAAVVRSLLKIRPRALDKELTAFPRPIFTPFLFTRRHFMSLH